MGIVDSTMVGKAASITVLSRKTLIVDTNWEELNWELFNIQLGETRGG